MSLNAWADLAIGAPLAVFFAMLLGMRAWPRAVVGLSVLSAFAVAVATWMLALNLPEGGFTSSVPWAVTDDFTVSFGFRLTGLSTAMACVVGTIHLLVQLYSVGYMADDPHKARFFGILSLFATAMLGIVLSSDLAQTFVAWELVGLASYLLIGFWNAKPSAAQAAKKAFIMTRFGDLGLFAGLALMVSRLGDLKIDTVLLAVESNTWEPGFVTAIGLCLLCGIAGKSAQFPLHTWLPDAMEGPTPVSSLLHSATMVAAGVYLFALLQPLFLASEFTATFALGLAVFTALLAATVACVETDMKRVLAWSSISQLSFMLMGLAAGSQVAGFFHLVTHAGFKCLLFLSAGLFIHAAHTGDLLKIGRTVGRSAPIAALGLVVGCVALSGFPGFAGFMSKELVLHAVHEQGTLFYGGALLTSALTAYYAFRLVFLALFDPQRERHESHGGGALMIQQGVVAALAVLTLGIGFAGPDLAAHLGFSADEAHIHWVSSGVAMAMVALVLGAGLAFVDFGRGGERLGSLAKVPALHRFFASGWGVDAFWRGVSDVGIAGLTRLALLVDRGAIDRSVDGVGSATKVLGGVAARMQTGRVQLYLSIGLGLLATGLLALGAL